MRSVPMHLGLFRFGIDQGTVESSSVPLQEFLRDEGISLDRVGCLIKQAEVTRLADSQGVCQLLTL